MDKNTRQWVYAMAYSQTLRSQRTPLSKKERDIRLDGPLPQTFSPREGSDIARARDIPPEDFPDKGSPLGPKIAFTALRRMTRQKGGPG